MEERWTTDPFSNIENFERLYNPWEGDGEGKFGFVEQPKGAGKMIMFTLAQALAQVVMKDPQIKKSLAGQGNAKLKDMATSFLEEVQNLVNDYDTKLV